MSKQPIRTNVLSVAIGLMLATTAAAAFAEGPDAGMQPGIASGHDYPELSRDAVTEIILGTWGPQLAATDDAWQERMQAVLEQADEDNLRRAMDVLDYEQMLAVLGGATVRGGDAAPLEIGDEAEDLVYTPIAPCRLIDTRVASPLGGRIPAEGTVEYYSWGVNFRNTQGGDDSNCGIPANPAAIALNVTAVNPSKAGFLTVYPAQGVRPSTSTVNYVQGEIVGNGTLAVARQGIGFGFAIYSFGETDVVADAVGYFVRPVATALDCTEVTQSFDSNPGTFNSGSVTCPTGRAATGGGCITASSTFEKVTRSHNNGSNGWTCRTFNEGGNPLVNTVTATCCRVPGR